MRNKLFVSVFGIFLVAVMLAAPIKRVLCAAGVIVNENVGNIIEVEKEYDKNAFGASVLNGVESVKRELTDIYTNYIPFYVDITSFAGKFTQTVNNPISSLLLDWGNKDAVMEEVPKFEAVMSATYLKNNKKHRYYQIDAQTEINGETESFYIRVPLTNARALKSKSEKMAAAFNKFAQESPEVNWYIYASTSFEDTALCDAVLPNESKRELFNSFFEKLSPAYKRGWVQVDSVEDKLNKYFKTDHHWNAYGYTEAYRSLVEMFKENYSDITVREPKIVTFPSVQYRGSNSTAIGRFDLYDEFAVATYDLPEHNCVIEDGVSYNSKISIETNMEAYLAGNHNTGRSYSHYMAFQPILKEVAYPENNTGRNLLLIGDSYSPPLMEPLASYFDKTYIRYIDTNPDLPDIDLDEYIKEYNITDVVFVEMDCRIVYDYYGDALNGLN